MRRPSTAVMFMIGALFTLLSIQVCSGEMYKYIDRQGTVVITDRHNSIPKQYRNKITVIKDTAPAPKISAPPAAAPVVGPSIAPEQQSATQPKSATQHESEPAAAGWQSRYRVPLGALAALLVAFFAIRRMAAVVGHRKIGAVVFVAISLFVAVYSYRIYVEKITGTFHGLKKDALNIKQNVETREQMTDRALQQTQDRR